MLTPDDLADIFSDIRTPLSFVRRPDPIPGDLRHSWRLAALVIVLDKCHSSTGNIEQVHLLIWAIRSKSSRALMRSWIAGTRMPDDFVVRYDPSLSRTIAVAVATGLVTRKTNQTIALTEKGKEFAKGVWASSSVMNEEKELLRSFTGKITQKLIRELVDWK